MTTNTTTLSRVRNYQGTNQFIVKMKEALSKWGNLTQKQLDEVKKSRRDWYFTADEALRLELVESVI